MKTNKNNQPATSNQQVSNATSTSEQATNLSADNKQASEQASKPATREQALESFQAFRFNASKRIEELNQQLQAIEQEQKFEQASTNEQRAGLVQVACSMNRIKLPFVGYTRNAISKLDFSLDSRALCGINLDSNGAIQNIVVLDCKCRDASPLNMLSLVLKPYLSGLCAIEYARQRNDYKDLDESAFKSAMRKLISVQAYFVCDKRGLPIVSSTIGALDSTKLSTYVGRVLRANDNKLLRDLCKFADGQPVLNLADMQVKTAFDKVVRKVAALVSLHNFELKAVTAALSAFRKQEQEQEQASTSQQVVSEQASNK